jgi:hypothetical protein
LPPSSIFHSIGLTPGEPGHHGGSGSGNGAHATQFLSIVYRAFDRRDADAPDYLSHAAVVVQGLRFTVHARFFHDMYMYFTDGPLGCLAAILVQHFVRVTDPALPSLHLRYVAVGWKEGVREEGIRCISTDSGAYSFDRPRTIRVEHYHF